MLIFSIGVPDIYLQYKLSAAAKREAGGGGGGGGGGFTVREVRVLDERELAGFVRWTAHENLARG